MYTYICCTILYLHLSYFAFMSIDLGLGILKMYLTELGVRIMRHSMTACYKEEKSNGGDANRSTPVSD